MNNEKKKKLFRIIKIFIIFILAFLIYAHYEYTNIIVKRIVIESKDIPQEFNGRKILFLADFQVDTIGRYNKNQMNRIIKLVNSQEKDIILLGGDYTNWTGKIERFYNQLEELKKPKYGVYSILGNHDYNDISLNMFHFKKLGYELLINENYKWTINNQSIYIAGVDDLWHGDPNATKALSGIKKEDFALLLNHNPDYFEYMSENEKKLADMTLSGHVHGGQVTFFGHIVTAPIKHKKKYGYGMKEYNGHKIYITSGVGGSAFEMFIRFFARPEIIIFELKKI